MTRVVTKGANVSSAVELCPVGAIKKKEKDFYIDPNACIDCGVCQSVATNGEIKEESDATADDVKFNADCAK